ncbi:MAG: hypothetical protein KIT84_15805 [Labilithrix sp.]|nr:hypothetical protein [Labilithrix sp.]MCW5812492.1 hypothetical protein [Labilithrix sp.]
MIGVLFCVMAALGVAFSLALIRADPRRWDNRVFGAMGLLDSAASAYRGVTLLGGGDLAEREVLIVCGALAIPLGWGSIEFAYSFPFSRPAPMKLRVPVGLATVASLFVALNPATRELTKYANYYYYTPAFVVMTALLVRSLRTAKTDVVALRLLAAALFVRWAFAIVVYGPVYDLYPEAFPTWIVLESTAGVVISYLLITLAILKSQLFSVRGFAADLIGLVGVGVLVVASSAVAVECALRLATGPSALRAALVLASLIPLTALVVSRGAIERAVARNVDPRRVRRERVLERALGSTEAEPDAMLKVIREALADLGATETRFVPVKELPPSLLARFAETKRVQLTRAEAPELDADLTVLVRSGDTVHGALAVRGDEIERDTVMAATTLADRFALRLDAFALFTELEASRKLATLGSFAAAIAHDIRTPLTSVKMNVQILRKKARLPADDMEYFDIALEELDRLAADVNELLDFAKPARVEQSVVDLRALVADAARATQPAFGERRLSLDVRHGEHAPLARGDALRLRQVIENLVTNAAAASPEGARVEIRTRREDDGRVALEVADEGKGIAPEDLPRIFEPFYTTRPDGTGLGLAICDKLVRAHGGEIRVDAAPGRGATFTVLLPAA